MKVLQLGIFLWIQTEFAYIVPKDEAPILTDIEEIPSSINVCGIKYALNGLAEFRPGHYVAWCRSSSGEWRELNDASDEKSPRKKINISSIFYARSE